MTTTALARHSSLLRAERAAGEAFGWPEAPQIAPARRFTTGMATAALTAMTVAGVLAYFL